MITAHDVNTVAFQKAVRGYRPEDVDKLLDDVAEQLDADTAEIAALKKSNEELKANMYLLAQKIEEYRADEENLKSALINAQRMGESVIREAKQKAEGILRDAAVKADNIVANAQEEHAEQTIELQRVKMEVSQFKADVLSLYRRHIESLSTLPEEEDKAAQDDALELDDEIEVATSFVEPQQEETVLEPAQEAAELEPVQKNEEQIPAASSESFDVMAQDAEPEQETSFWTQDETQLNDVVVEPQKEEVPAFNAFKGIKFSD